MKAFLALRDGLHYRREAFAKGLMRVGYTVVFDITLKPGPDDVLVIWNRYRENAIAAERFESAGRPVLVAENGYLGNEVAGERWYAISHNQHNGAGTWPNGGPERWDALGIELLPWRKGGGEVVILPQRGIGPPGVAMPAGWAERCAMRLAEKGIKTRIRPHPGIRTAIPLEDDLANARAVVTWGSGAALKALTWGIPAFSDWGDWIGAPAALPVAGLIQGDYNRSDGMRREVFRAMAWAQWRITEITSGEAFKCLLNRS